MNIQWNKTKAEVNLRKHGVDFADAAVALEDANALTIEDMDVDERRFKTLALGPDIKVLLVVHAERDEDTIRIISARKADHSETMQFYRGISYE
jgi:uncharacterized DUF497 family protein